MSSQERHLSLDMIESSPEIQEWLDQFSKKDQDVATDMLLRLCFITRDTFSEWIKKTILNIYPDNAALYSVRKMSKDTQSIWEPSGQITGRPGHAQGSEDLVFAIIRQLCREFTGFENNPDLDTIRRKCIQNIILIDDSIGSGERVSGFISKMFKNKTIMSWWSYGLLRIHIVSYARSQEGEKNIFSAIPGSDHPKRKYPKSKKIFFIAKYFTQKNT